MTEFAPVFSIERRPILIAGPCSAETEAQTLETARALARSGRVDLFRAGIWKPRTRPNSFEGVGSVGLEWLKKAKAETGLPMAVEVASARHVEAALRASIDVLWIGARSTANPFTVQEIAEALRGAFDTPVLVKNPVNADLDLWIGGIERIAAAGVRRIAAIHRGFSHFGKTPYRNVPLWQLPIELGRQFPYLQLIGDPSHICGNREMLLETSQQMLDLNYAGLMIETHPRPDEAWSDARQQIEPDRLIELLDSLVARSVDVENSEFSNQIEAIRQKIDHLDAEMLRLLGDRMQLSEQIGQLKRLSNVSILQPRRWAAMLERGIERGSALQLSPSFVAAVFQAMHQESINRQASVMRPVSALENP